ncbi:hypothetical protein, partial [Brevundimonas sp.]
MRAKIKVRRHEIDGERDSMNGGGLAATPPSDRTSLPDGKRRRPADPPFWGLARLLRLADRRAGRAA